MIQSSFIQPSKGQFELYTNPEMGCPSGAKVEFVCLNPACTKPSFHCQDCKDCKFHIQNQCESFRLKLLTQMMNKQHEDKKRVVKRMIQVDGQMLQKMKLSKENLLKSLGSKHLEKKQVEILESIFMKPSKKQDIFGKDMAKIVQKMKKTKDLLVSREEQVLKIYRQKIEQITQKILELDKIVIQVYSDQKNVQLNSKIINPDALADKEFIFQSLEMPLRPKKLELLFRASEYHFLASKFHQKCDNIQHTFTLIKTQFGKIIAGYTPLKWRSSEDLTCYKDTSAQSFLLSISLRQKLKLNKSKVAIICHPNYGPVFGEGWDIFIDNACDKNSSSFARFPESYNYSVPYVMNQQTNTKFSGATTGPNFKVLEYEVFQVVW